MIAHETNGRAPARPDSPSVPTDDEAEKYVAGAVMQGPDEVDLAREILTVADFRVWPYARVFEAAGQVRDAGLQVEPASVFLKLKQAGQLGDLGDNPLDTLIEISRAAGVGIVNLHLMARQVRDAAIGRRLVFLSAELARDAGDRIEPAEDTAARFEAKIAEAAAEASAGEPVSVAEALAAGVEDLRARRDPGTRRVWTGFADLDRIVPSLDAGSFTVVGARPSVGKTAFGLSVALNAAGNLGVPVYFVSLEMSRGELAQRLAYMATGKSGHKFRSGQATPHEIDVLAAEAQRLIGEARLRVDDAPGLKVEQILGRARRVRRRVGLGLVVVDYLQLVSPSNPRSDRREAVEQISRSLKRMARELACPVVALAQLNRDVENRADPRPRLSDLREAGGIEADADAVLLLWRHPNQPDEAEVWQIGCAVAKQRNGPTGELTLHYRRACTRFEDPAPIGV